jgi:catechol 2,3-dioxygenase-like lactoylglutathione lyase family enzyme
VDLTRGAHVEHVALWARDFDRRREFYVEALGGRCGAL